MANKRRQACRPIRSFPADTAACETWLSDMAAKGLHLDKMAKYFAWFDRGEPMENVRFRVEPVTKEDDWVTAEEREGFREMGWDYLDTWENLYRIYRADDPTAPELHTDPRTQALTLDRLIRKNAKSLLIVLGIWIACCALFIATADSFTDLLIGSVFYVDLSIIFLTALLFFDRGGLLDLLELRRSLRRGEPQPHPTVRRFGLPAGILALIMAVFPIITSTLNLFEFPHYRTITETQDLPYVSIFDIEDDPQLERITDATPNWGQDYFHSYQRTRSLLVPEYCITRQYGIVPEAIREPYRPQLYITRYHLLTEGLAVRVYDDLYTTLPDDDSIALTLSVSDIDEQAAWTGDSFNGNPWTDLILRDGRTVLMVQYWGEADLTAHLEAFAALAE
ncbi:MAG: DUF2812 domain-containing protein [Butyricicoccus sp.]|nr:DUF2812 domain-containing protein [Butyricicoccus sp.]